MSAPLPLRAEPGRALCAKVATRQGVKLPPAITRAADIHMRAAAAS